MLEELFETETACDVEGDDGVFAPDMAGYMDATLGWDFGGYAALTGVFEQYMPAWTPPVRSYASKILAGKDGALVHMVDTPELFGGELPGLRPARPGAIVAKDCWMSAPEWDSPDTGDEHQRRRRSGLRLFM